MLGLQDAIAANAGTPRAGRLFRFHRTARRLAARAEKGMAEAWVRALERAQRGISEKALRTALASRDLAAAQAAIAASSFGQMMQDLEDPIARTAGATGAASAQTMRASGYAAQFNATHPNVILFARDRSATLVRDITETAREAVRTVIALGAQEGLTIVDQARAIREVVGLPPAWASAPLRLEQAIRRGDTAAATARRLSATDKAQIRSRVAAGTVNETFIAEVRERYTKSLINRRALNIARTETIRAVNFGQHESWAQAARGGVIPRGARRFWLATPTPTLCENCAKISGMNPKGRGLEEPFDTPFGQVMYPPGHTACRCGIGLALPPRAQALRGPGGRGGVGRKLKTAGRGANVPMLPIDRALAKMQKQGLPIEEFLMEEVPRNVAFQETASLVSAGLDDIQRMGFRVPKGVRLFLDRPSGMARGQLGGFAYGVEAHPALIFPTRTLGAMRAEMGRLVQKGWVSTQNVRGLIHHELGHALHYEALGFRAKNMKAVGDTWYMTRFGKGKAWQQFAPQDLRAIARRVSGYAEMSPSEFVAEVFTGLVQGERYAPEVLQLYKHLKGPIAKRWKGMFRGISDDRLIIPKGAGKVGERVAKLAGPKVAAGPPPVLEIDKAIPRLKARGIVVPKAGAFPRFSQVIKDSLSVVVKAVDDVAALGFKLKPNIQLVFGKLPGGQPGAFTAGVGRTSSLIMPTRLMKEMVEDVARSARKGWSAARNPQGLLHHELGHALHYQVIGDARFGKMGSWVQMEMDRELEAAAAKRLAKQVSGYAANSPVDFVAETFTGLMRGEQYSSAVLDMYKALNGPIAKAWEPLFQPGGVLKMRGPLPETARARRALKTHKPATAEKQAAGDQQQRTVAKALQGKSTPDNDPLDVVFTDAQGRTVGIEVKTFCDQANNKVTMHPDSLARKQAWARKNKGRTVTVVVDTRDQFGFADLYSGKRYWVKEGVGSFRLDTMEGFDSLADATAYIKTGRRVLKLEGPVAYGRPARSFEGEAARGVLERASRGVKLSAGAKDAVIEYQQGIAWTPRPQRILRGMEKGALTADERAVVKGLDVALAAVRPLTDEVVVYRGAHELPAALKKVGTVFQDKGFVSTTIHGQKAVNFSSSFSERGALIRIRVPAGTRGGWLPRLTGIDFKGEGEFLLPRGLRYHVVSAERMSWGKAAGRLGGKAPSWGGSQKTWLIDVEVVPVRPIAKRWKGMFRGISDTKLIVPKGAVEKAGARVWRLVELGALPTEAPTVESFTKKAAERGFRTVKDVADDLKALVPEADVAGIEFSSPRCAVGKANAFFDPVTRKVHMSRDASERMVAFWQGDRSPRTIDAVRTLVHEYLHSTSPMLRARKMEGWWGFLEEGIVETRAREATLRFMFPKGDILAALRHTFTSYKTEVEAVQWLQKTFGRDLVDQLWTLDSAAARTKLLSTKMRGWLLRKLPKQGLTVRETHAVATNLGDDAWHILRVGDQEKLLRMRGARLREYLGENYSVEIPSPAKVVRKEKLIAYDKPLKLEPLETKAVKDYQSQGWNSIINGALRKGKTSGILRVQGGAGQYDLGKTVQAIDVVLARAPRLKKSVALWRGLNGEKGLTLRPGTVFRDKGFVSTSTEMRRAAEFMLDARKPVMLRIAAKKGQRGIWMKDAIGRTKEAEFLLPRGSRFRVVKSQVMDHSRFNREIGRVGWFYGTGLHVTVLDVQLL